MTRTLTGLRWAITLVSFALIVIGYVLLTQAPADEPAELFAFKQFDAIAAICYIAVAWLILIGRPSNGIGWFLLGVGVVSAISWVVSRYAVVSFFGDEPLPGGAYAGWVQVWIWALIVVPLMGILPGLYPHGRFQSRLGKFAAIGVVPAVLLLAIGESTKPGPMLAPTSNTLNPFGLENFPHQAIEAFGLLVMLAAAISGAWALFLKYRRGTEIERLQIKWLLTAVVFVISQFVGFGVIFAVGGDANSARVLEILLSLGFLAIPISMGFAVTRYRLYEIDVVINRAVVYGPLTAAVAASYVASVQLARIVFVAVTGERSQSELLVATIIAAAVFWMIRTRMVGLVDRHFKDPREPAKDLRRLREELVASTRFMEPSAISHHRIATHAVETIVAAYDSVGGTIKLRGTRGPAGTIVAGEPADEPALTFDLAHEGRTYGTLLLGPRQQAKPYSERDHEPLTITASALGAILAQRATR
jgi:hypothetical protein